KIFRVRVVGDRFGLKTKEAFEVLYALFERAQRLQVFQIADVVTQEGVRPARQAESVFQLRAAGEYLALEFERGLQRRGRVAERVHFGRDRRRDIRTRVSFEQHDWAARVREQTFFGLRDDAKLFNHINRSGHQRERLVLPVLSSS